MKSVISTGNAPLAVGPYSQGIETPGLVITSGQLPLDPTTGEFASGDIKGQTKQSLENVRAVLQASGLDLCDVVKTTVFLQDMNDFSAMNEVYAEYFNGGAYPARSALQVAKLPKNALVEIEAIAWKR